MNSELFIYKQTPVSFKHYNNEKITTVVCLHGFLEYKEIFDFLDSVDIHERFNILTIDLLGHGQSGNIGYVHAMDDQADMVFDLLSYLKIKDIIILGHSMGGYVGLSFLNHYNSYVNRLILLNSAAKDDSEERKKNRLRGIELVKKNKSIFIQMAISNLFKEETKKNKTNQIKVFKNTAINISTQGCIAAMYGMLERKDQTQLLYNTDKIIYMGGLEDELIPKEDILNEIKGSDTPYNFVEGGHMLWLENPEEIKKLLINL